MRMRVLLLVTFCLASLLGSFAEQCGQQANYALCPNGLCCSSFGFCGTTPPYCGGGCQSQCNVGDVMSSVITSSVFDKLLLHRNDAVCPMRGFYTYEAFIAATRDYPSFGKTGDKDTRKREVAAFLAHTSHETNGGWEGAPDGPFAWGYCYMLVQANCQPSQQVPRRAAYFKQKPEAEAIAIFKNALCIWMTPEDSKPSGHEIMSGIWKPTEEDEVAGRFPGFGATTNVLNGRVECGHGNDTRGEQRIGFYKRFCKILGVHPGDHLDCYNQVPFDKLSMQATSKISLLLANSMM